MEARKQTNKQTNKHGQAQLCVISWVYCCNKERRWMQIANAFVREKGTGNLSWHAGLLIIK